MSDRNGREMAGHMELMSEPAEIELQGRRATAQRWAAAGTSGIEMTGGFLNLAHTSELTWPGVYPLFERIRRTDPEIAIIRTLFNALAQEVRLEWKEPENANEAEKRFTEFLSEVFADVTGGITGLATTTLNQVPFMGWGWWEVLPGLRRQGWKAPGVDDWESQYSDGLVGIRRFDWRHHSSFTRWDADEKSGRVLGFVQNDSPNDEVTIPLGRSLHVVHGDTISPEGLSPLEAVWRLERYKYNLEIVQGIGFSHAAGHVKFSTQTQLTSTDKSIIRAAALSVFSGREGSYMSLPKHIEGELIDGRFSSAGEILAAIRYYGIVKLQVYNMQWAAMSTTSGQGSYSAHRDGSSMFVTYFNGMMRGYAAQIGETVAKRVLGWNRLAFAGLVRLPTLEATPLDKAVELGSLSNFVAQVWPMLDVSEEDILAVRKYSGVMPVKVPEEGEVVEKPQPPGQAMKNQPGNLEEPRRRFFRGVELYDPAQPRDKYGKWSSGGGWIVAPGGGGLVARPRESSGSSLSRGDLRDRDWKEVGDLKKEGIYSTSQSVIVEADGQRAILKTNERIGWGYGEEAAHVVGADFMGMDNIPASIALDDKRSLQALLGEGGTLPSGQLSDVEITEQMRGDFRQIALLDAVTGNTDRHMNNVYLSEGRMWAIDNDHSFFDKSRMRIDDMHKQLEFQVDTFGYWTGDSVNPLTFSSGELRGAAAAGQAALDSGALAGISDRAASDMNARLSELNRLADVADQGGGVLTVSEGSEWWR